MNSSDYFIEEALKNRVPLLSICIATLNRAAFIGETLDSIVSQLEPQVEIVILDGASTDNTEEVVQHYKQLYPRLRYVRQNSNHGVDRDYNTAMELSTGEYCWLMTDDDLIKPGAIPAVLDAIRQGHSLIVMNAEVRNADLSNVLQARRIEVTTNQVFSPEGWGSLFTLAGAYLSFIGCVVIKRALWIGRNKEPYFGTLFIHMGVIFQNTLPGTSMVIAEPYISIRYGNAMWRPKEFEIWMFKWPNLIWSFPNLSDDEKQKVTAKEPWRFISNLLFYRAKGTYSFSDYRFWIKPRTSQPLQKYVAVFVSMLPGPLVNFMAVMYCKLVRRDALTSLLELRNSRYYIKNWAKLGNGK